MSLLATGTQVGPYRVVSFIKDGEVNETYRVEDTRDHSPRFMKLFIPSRVPKFMKTADGEISEIALSRGLDNEFVMSNIDDGVYADADGVEHPYYVSNYFTGRLLSEMISCGKPTFTFDQIADVFRAVAQGLKYLHEKGLVHNDITPRNVMFNPETGAVQIIDLGHISPANSTQTRYLEQDLEALYRSPENFRNSNSPAGDVFAAAAVAYAMATGHAPWPLDLSAIADSREREREIKMAVHRARKKKLDFAGASVDTPEWFQNLLRASLAIKADERLGLDEIIAALDARDFAADPASSDAAEETSPIAKKDAEGPTPNTTAPRQKQPEGKFDVKKGNGFADVAGMDELKDFLSKKVLFILKDPEKAKKYRLTPPNGMLLYGPPGCGKTYFAEKFAEESGFNFKFVKASDIGSIYVHGGQGKIAELFDAARKQAPVILCFDEFDAMVPDRSSRGAEHIAGEVNEFLSQLNNCGNDGVFVIGTTNQPEIIDRAVLRKGRLDISVYIPEPDAKTRQLMFDLHLKERPCADIDTQKLAEMTNNYVSSDIAFIVNDAAMIAAFRDEPITQAGLEESIKATRPSLSDAMLKTYAEARQRIENVSSNGRPRVGFIQSC